MELVIANSSLELLFAYFYCILFLKYDEIFTCINNILYLDISNY